MSSVLDWIDEQEREAEREIANSLRCACPDTWDCPLCVYECERCMELRRLYGQP